MKGRLSGIRWMGGTMVSVRLFPLLFAGLACQAGVAAPLYKWVDRAGEVTYSSAPPPAGAKAEKLTLAPPPTAAEVRQAEDRVKRIETLANELADQRLQKEADEARLAAAPPAPVVVEKPVYVPQPSLYAPVLVEPLRRPHTETHRRHRPR
jgi:hypothetical protein